MENSFKTNQVLLKENALLKKRIRELVQAELEHIQAENALLESEENASAILREMHDGFWLMHVQDSMILDVNEAMCRLLGYTREEILKIPIAEIAVNDSPELISSRSKHIIKFGSAHFESSFKCKNGTFIDVEVSATYLSKRKLFFCFCRDVTDSKSLEKELLDSKTILQAVMDGTPDAVFVKDCDSRMLMANPATLAILGKSTEQIIGKESKEIHENPDVVRAIMEHDKLVISSGKAFLIEEKVPTVDGLRVYQSTKAPYRDGAGKIIGVIGISRDITEYKQAKEELEKHRSHLENIVKERTEELENKNIALQELNMALKVLLQKREDDKNDMEERFLINIQNLILPYIEQLKQSSLGARQRSQLDIMEAHLHEIATPLLKNIRQFNFTPREIQVAILVRHGKSTKECAEILGIASSSIDVYRKSIRKKLGLSNRSVNLISYLDSLQQ
ncbi:MAG: PAS domain S-box protein [Proteobacteria bacterium]|nr:PAS domain S-box protein [Pseudomonadota bacterium]